MKIFHIFGTTLEYKTRILVFNIASGLLSLAVVSALYYFMLKNDYDALFLEYSQSLIHLENLRKTINNARNIPLNAYNEKKLNAAQENILLQLESYKIMQNKLDSKGLLHLLLSVYDYFDKDKAQLIGQKKSLEAMFITLEAKTQEYTQLLNQKGITESLLQQKANVLNHIISEIIRANLQFAELKKVRNNAIHNVLQKVIIVIMCLIMLITLLLSFLILRNIKGLHNTLESKVQEKTKELQELNNSLQETIKKEVLESRKKDQIMYQQARLASMGEMIGNIAHQWRQPLNALILLIQAFKVKAHNGKLTQEFIKAQVDEGLRIAKRMSQTIEDFRNFFNSSSIEEVFNLRENIEDSISLVDAFLKQDEIEISIQCVDNIELVGYKSAFSQVLLNLIKNAQDVLKERTVIPAKIRISVSAKQDFVEILFMDNGGGIKLDDIQKVFEPYFTTKHKSVGTGIGLYMSKQIIEKQMQGSIEVRNVCYDNAFNIVCAGGECAQGCALQEGICGAQFVIMIPLNSGNKD